MARGHGMQEGDRCTCMDRPMGMQEGTDARAWIARWECRRRLMPVHGSPDGNARSDRCTCMCRLVGTQEAIDARAWVAWWEPRRRRMHSHGSPDGNAGCDSCTCMDRLMGTQEATDAGAWVACWERWRRQMPPHASPDERREAAEADSRVVGTRRRRRLLHLHRSPTRGRRKRSRTGIDRPSRGSIPRCLSFALCSRWLLSRLPGALPPGLTRTYPRRQALARSSLPPPWMR